MELARGQRLHGFTVETAEALPEIDGTAYTLRHDASRARLLYLANDDANKAFSISFKTPPADDTGVFHILEHSVLCGSDKFPVKEPFVNLLKTSMQTFLNAMTFPDKTMYPVASTNEQDLLNLMDVYLDAVLHPAIYRKPEIFQQEGWHLECAEGKMAQGGIAYNGVVYNEMKGALSSPDSVLYDALSAALFPDTAYRYESGGDPASIPELAYEGFLDNHRRHYRLDNSYIMLYGDLDADRALAFLDERYLAPGAAEQDALPADCVPNPLRRQAPVVADDVVRTMRTAPENAMCGAAFAAGDVLDRRRIVAVDVLLDALMGSNESPLKRALLDAELGDDVSGFLSDSILQPFAVIQVKGAREGSLARLRETIRKTCERLCEEGIDRAILDGALSHAEFVMREHDFGVADGVSYAMSSMAGWLYDDDAATLYLRYEDDFAALREGVGEGLFERLVREVFLENDHRASVDLVPEPDAKDGEGARLADVAASLSEADRTRIAADAEALRALQGAPDDPAALAALPRLSRADIGDPAPEPAFGPIDGRGVACIRHDLRTHGITYAYRYFDAGDVLADEAPYLALLATLLGKLDTARRSAADLDALVQNELGNLSFFVEVYEDSTDASKVAPRFAVGASALSERTPSLASIPWEVLRETDFSDTDKIRGILVQKRVALEQGFSEAGHAFAITRATAHVRPAGAAGDLMAGVGFYRFLKGVLEGFNEHAPELSKHLADLAARVFTPNRCTLDVAGGDADIERLIAADAEARPATDAGQHAPEPAYAEKPGAGIATLPAAREAFAVPSDVVYASCANDLRRMGVPYSGVWQVAAQVLSLDYLWTEVRVKGGAYGVGFQAAYTGRMRFYSYRDPHLDETLASFEAAGDYLASFTAAPEDIDGYVVSTAAAFDAPKKPRQLMRRQYGDLMSGRTRETRRAARDEIVSATSEGIRALAPAVTRGARDGAIAAFGNRDIIDAASGFAVTDLLAETPADPESVLDGYRAK